MPLSVLYILRVISNVLMNIHSWIFMRYYIYYYNSYNSYNFTMPLSVLYILRVISNVSMFYVMPLMT